MEICTFKEIFSSAGKLPSRIVLCIDVKAQTTLKDFKAADQNGDIHDLEIVTGKQALMKMIVVGRKIRMVYPEIDIKKMKVKVVDRTKIYLNQAAEKQGK